VDELLAIMERLRGAEGCPWDRAQTFATIAPYTIEESYEVADAVERGDMAHLKDELGDLLFQVVFHAQIAREAGHFDFDAVAAAMCGKLIRRHPHVFGEGHAAGGEVVSGAGAASGGVPGGGAAASNGAELGAGAAASNGGVPGGGAAVSARIPLSVDQQSVVWEDIKAGERAATLESVSAVAGVPLALPALMRALKLSKRAARVGFDFEHAHETADKVAEELAEVREAARANAGSAASPEVVEEIGDLLFAAANLARKLDVDAEAALRAANIKFERRFQGMERLAAQRGVRFESLGLAAQEALWLAVKRGE
jgi:nucleoside triphosphate diphosphatase